MALLEVTGIGKRFGSTHVLEDISLSLEQGRGAGHHRLLRFGQNDAAALPEFFGDARHGRIVVDGETLWDAADPATHKESEKRKKRLHFGLVFQNFNLFPQYTALQNIMLAGELLAREQPDYKQNRPPDPRSAGTESPRPAGPRWA